jgi:Tfp pilus assembly protein PilV
LIEKEHPTRILILMKIAKIVLGLLFLLAMYWQFNDAAQYGNHDAWFWIFFYLTASLLTFALVKWKPPSWLLPGIIGFCLGSAIFRMQDEVGNFDISSIWRATAVPSQMNKTTQKPNEVDALFLVGGWFLVVMMRERHKNRKA